MAWQLRKIEPVASVRRDKGGHGMRRRPVSGSPDQVTPPVLFFGML